MLNTAEKFDSLSSGREGEITAGRLDDYQIFRFSIPHSPNTPVSTNCRILNTVS